MGRITFGELCKKEVINLCGGVKLGRICDIEIDSDDDKITAIIIPSDNDGLLCFKKEYFIIPLCKIECLGDDTVLVKIPQAELVCCELPKKKKR